jgi:hypothetical protein
MRAFIYKTVLFILIILSIDFISGIILDYFYQHPKSGIVFQEDYIINKTSQEVLIFGSSRAAFHYIPDIISKETSLSTYNVGREGTGIYFHYAILLATLERYNPKVVVLDLDFRDYYNRGGNFGTDVFKELLPYYGKVNPVFDSLVTPEWYDPLFAQSSLYKYNKKFFNIVSGTIEKGKNNHSGYRPLIGNWDKVSRLDDTEELIVDNRLAQSIRAFIQKAKNNGIKVIIVLSPSFREMPIEFASYVESIPSIYKVDVLNHYNDSTFLGNYDLFHDEEHLNNLGAEVYSKQIAKEINAIIEIDK